MSAKIQASDGANKAPVRIAEAVTRATTFAQHHIAPRRHELITSADFPPDLWQDFIDQGLTGLTAPLEIGGGGADYQTLSAMAAALNRHGRVPGVAMTILGHLLATKLHIMADAPAEMQADLLPRLADGSAIVCVAISEPGAGAHPKKLMTAARLDGDEFVLNGEKAFLTKGPMASHFIVLAITAENAGRKAFSAILVPETSPGLTKTPGVPIDFLHPCPHGGIVLQDCRVPSDNLVGVAGAAFQRTSMRMRAIEDAVGAGPQVASLLALLADLLEMPDALEAAKLQPGDVAALAMRLKALALLAENLAALADAAGDDLNPLLETQAGFRQLMQAAARDMQDFLQPSAQQLKPETQFLARDIAKSHAIANAAHLSRLTKIGTELLKEPSRL
jgi:alkylation response protein AidB-like acyl-CoA dehydrogenase